MARIRLIAADVDGTLLTDAREPSPGSLQAVRAARDLGIHVCLCSGRNHTEIKDLCALAGMSDLTVINNGASIINWRTGVHAYRNRFNSHHIADMLRALLRDAKAHPLPTIYTAGSFKTHILRAYSDEGMLRRGQIKTSASGFTAEAYYIHDAVEDWLQASTADTQRVLYNIDAKRHGSRIKKLLAPYGDVSITTGMPGRMEILPAGTSKGEGLRRLCERYGLRLEEAMAIGDGANDEEMIRMAGIGVAMGNAAQRLKDTADYITDSNEEEGFQKALDRYVLNRVDSIGEYQTDCNGS